MPAIGRMPAACWQKAFQHQEDRIRDRMHELYGSDGEILASRQALYLQALETFIQHYGADREVVISRAPGRINLLGNHIDHRGGYVNYIVINRETLTVSAERSDDRVEMRNANARFGPRSFEINAELPPEKRGDWFRYIETLNLTPGDWGNYIRAAVLHLQDRFADRALKGLDLAIAGDIPIAAGLSSSSSLVVSALEAALTFNGLEVPGAEKAEFCGAAEWYVGTRGGSGDHAAMLYSKRQSILPLHFFPLRTREVPLPEGYRVVACNSFVEHTDKSVFNERVATYEIGLLLVKNTYPQYAEKLVHLRDLNADHLGVPLTEIYRILKALPERMSRAEIRNRLPDHRDTLETLFAPHPEPEEGYRVRQVVLFGLAECARGALCGGLLQAGDMEAFGKLKYRSHNGDRQFTWSQDGKIAPQDNRISDAQLNQRVADLESGDPARVEAAQIHLQPGGYDCSCEELDCLVDLARQVEGVMGAGLTGGGLGGCVLVFVREDAVGHLQDTLENQFYKPRTLKDGMLVCASVAGSGLV